MSNSWSKSEINALIALVKDGGLSYRGISRQLGRSRSSICGKVRELQIGKGRPKAQPAPVKVTKMPAPPKTNDAARIMARHRAEASVRSLWRLVDLGESQCHFPFGDPAETPHVYCGAPAVPGKAYCRSCVSRIEMPIEVRHVTPAKPVQQGEVRSLVDA